MKMVCSSASTSSGSLSVKFGVRLTTKPSRFSKPVLSPAVTARRSLLRRIRRQELRKLRALLPSMRQRRVDEVRDMQTVDLVWISFGSLLFSWPWCKRRRDTSISYTLRLWRDCVLELYLSVSNFLFLDLAWMIRTVGQACVLGLEGG